LAVDWEGDVTARLKLFKGLIEDHEEFKTRMTREKILIDLWLYDGILKRTNLRVKNVDQVNHKIDGEVVFIKSEREIRVDCGILVDIKNEEIVKGIEIGDYIKTHGTFQVFFPNTEFSYPSPKRRRRVILP